MTVPGRGALLRQQPVSYQVALTPSQKLLVTKTRSTDST